jgi:DNA uptake protein ComE-like DNA-binding protein
MLPQPYSSKHAPFDSVDELRLVYGVDLPTLYGEDANLNGFLDPNEDDADNLPPYDNHDGRLDPGLLEYLTIYTREPINDTNGNARVNISSRSQQSQTALRTLLQQQSIPQKNIGNIVQSISTNPAPASVLEFYIRNIKNLSESDFANVEPSLTTSTNYVAGLININTASEEVLASIPQIGSNNAPAIVSYRESNPNRVNSTAWLTHAMNITVPVAQQIGPRVTTHSYQFTADIAAVGSFGRGYRRVKFVFDTSEGLPKIIYRQDLTHLGWALGPMAREVARTL